MRIAKTEFASGYFYHLYNHAVQHSKLFCDQFDYKKCFDLLIQKFNSPDFTVVAFCLMPNHYHLLIRQNSDCPIYYPLNSIWQIYSSYYNKKHTSKGSIFASKLQHIGIGEEQHLFNLIVYIHMNPIEAGLENNPQEWEWSNCREWLGIRKSCLIDHEMRNSYFPAYTDYQSLLCNLSENKKLAKLFIDHIGKS